MFALGLVVLGVIALGELYLLMGRVRPPALAGFVTLGALIAAALYGEPRHVIMVLAASFPVTFFLAVLRPRREVGATALPARGHGPSAPRSGAGGPRTRRARPRTPRA